MRALSLWRPWPWAFTHADKRIENRDWEIKFRGDVVFQAAKKFDAGAMFVIQRAAIAGGFTKHLCSGMATAHPAGVLSFVAEVVDCLPIEEIQRRAAIGECTVYDPDHMDKIIDWKRQAAWSFGPWCTVLVNVRSITREIPWKGSQGWFDVPDAIVAEALAV